MKSWKTIFLFVAFSCSAIVGLFAARETPSHATPGNHHGEKCTVMFLGKKDGTQLRGFFSARIASDQYFFADYGKLSLEDVSAFPEEKIREAVIQNKGSAVFADFIMDYEVTGKKARVEKAVPDDPHGEGIRLFPDFEAMGPHKNRKCTAYFRPATGNHISIQFLHLQPEDLDSWPRSGAIIVQEGQEVFPLAEIRDALAKNPDKMLFRNFLLDYEITGENKIGPAFAYAKVTKVVPLH
jgi:hypothetical protein